MTTLHLHVPRCTRCRHTGGKDAFHHDTVYHALFECEGRPGRHLDRRRTGVLDAYHDLPEAVKSRLVENVDDPDLDLLAALALGATGATAFGIDALTGAPISAPQKVLTLQREMVAFLGGIGGDLWPRYARDRQAQLAEDEAEEDDDDEGEDDERADDEDNDDNEAGGDGQ